jgi:Flp pilus assembly protein TadG
MMTADPITPSCRGTAERYRRRNAVTRLLGAARDRAGTVVIEFAMVLPVLALMIFGIIMFGLVLSNYVDLTEGVRVTARVLAQASAYPTQAYSNAQTYFAEATANLIQANLTMSVTVNGTACSTAATCDTALAAAAGDAVTVTGTYSVCIEVMGYNFLPGCQLTATTTQMVE